MARSPKPPIYGPIEPRLERLDPVVPPAVIDAMLVASGELRRLRVRHLLVGALAAGCYGAARTTFDVDFVVGDEAYERYDARSGECQFACLVPGVPVRVMTVRDSVAIDLFPAVHARLAHELKALVIEDVRSGHVPVASVDLVIVEKLRLWRSKDKRDVEALFRQHPDLGPWVESDVERLGEPVLLTRLHEAYADGLRGER